MEKLMEELEIKSFDHPDEVRKFEKGVLELVTVAGGISIGRIKLEPGWKWSECVKPIAKTKSCEAPHFQYLISGVMRFRMDDGTEKETKAGDVLILPPGHDAWVVGNKPVIAVDFQGMADYAKRR